MTIKVTPYHLKLLKRITINRGGQGVPVISTFPMYGDIPGSLLNNIGDAFDWNRFENIGNDWAQEQIEFMMETHNEMHHVIDILVKTRGIETGFYRRIDNCWTKVQDSTSDDVLPGQLGLNL